MPKIVIISVLFATFIYAEIVEFSGSTSLYAEYNPINGNAPQTSTSTLRFDLNPELKIAGMPLTLNLNFSTEESNLRQAVNKFLIFLAPANLVREIVHLPNFVFSISSIEIGACHPNYSPFTLTGVPVLGGATEINPWGVIYLAGAIGKMQRGVEGSDSTDAAYSRNLLGGRFGIGSKSGSHLYFTFLHIDDDTGSIPTYTLPVAGDSDTVDVITPQENYLVGAEFNLSLFQDHFVLKSELVGSEFTRDKRMPALEMPEYASWFGNVFNPRMSSVFDYAYSIKPTFDILHTKIWGVYKMVGPGFSSLGAPYLRNDVSSLEIGIDKGFFNKCVSLSVSHTREKDNLIGNKATTTSFQSYSYYLGLIFTGIPYLSVGYVPYDQQNDSLETHTDVLTMSTGYTFDLFKLNHSPSVSFSHQKYDESTEVNNFTSNSYYINYAIGFGFPLNITVGFGKTNTDYTTTKTRTTAFDISTAYTFFQVWTNTIGYNLSSEKHEGSRHGITFASSLPIWGICDMNLGVERNIYRERSQTINDYDEWRFMASLSKSW